MLSEAFPSADFASLQVPSSSSFESCQLQVIVLQHNLFSELYGHQMPDKPNIGSSNAQASFIREALIIRFRSIEYMLSIVDEKRVLRSFSSKKNFTKTRYSSELDIDRKVEINDLLTEDSPLLVNGELHLQLTLRPID
ncbi:hypothetical protein OSTOST_14410 [Ostertagia ostertagi]